MNTCLIIVRLLPVVLQMQQFSVYASLPVFRYILTRKQFLANFYDRWLTNLVRATISSYL